MARATDLRRVGPSPRPAVLSRSSGPFRAGGPFPRRRLTPRVGRPLPRPGSPFLYRRRCRCQLSVPARAFCAPNGPDRQLPPWTGPLGRSTVGSLPWAAAVVTSGCHSSCPGRQSPDQRVHLDRQASGSRHDYAEAESPWWCPPRSATSLLRQVVQSLPHPAVQRSRLLGGVLAVRLRLCSAGWCRDVAHRGGVSRPDGIRGLVQGRSARRDVLAVRLRLCSAGWCRDVAHRRGVSRPDSRDVVAAGMFLRFGYVCAPPGGAET
jgi:hypothetical protein